VVPAEKSLLSDRINNELLFINLATVPAEGILFPHLQQAVKRYLGLRTNGELTNFDIKGS
ncbi:MAG TPA: hypothetical protein PLU58_13975, partial [Saprospiraceae bacterium]|nr:hypothetical protein [Saprospiraceae bacterium]